MKLFIITTSLFVLSVLSFAQDTPLKLELRNNETLLPITAATVHSNSYSFSGTTDDNGIILIPTSLVKDDSILVISSVGFTGKTIAISQLQHGQVNTILMSPAASSLKEVVVSGRWSSGPLQTISKLDIHLNPILNSQEVLRIVPGLFIGQHAGGGKAEQIFLRGFDIDHGTDIRLTADGLPVNMVSHAHGQGYADMHFIIPEMIENVNFGKGPYNTDKGNFATAGFVDYKTKNFLENNFAKIEVGQYNTGRLVAGINLLPKSKQQRNNQSLIFSGEAMVTDGFFESSQDFTRFNGMLKYHGQVSPGSFVTAFVSGFTSKWLASGQIPERAVQDGTTGWFGAIDDTEGGQTSRYNASASLQTYLPNGMQWKNQVFYSRYLFDLYSNFTFFLVDPVNGDQIRQKEARNIWGYNSSFEKNHYLGVKRAWLQAGAQIRYDDINDIGLSRTKNRTELLERLTYGNINELNAGLFAEEKIQLSNMFDVTVGLRGDYFSNRYANKLDNSNLRSSSFMASPKLNIDFRPNKNLKIYWHNGQGFHSNDTRVAVQQNGREVVTPAWGSDLGAVIKAGDKLVIQSALWYLFMRQEFIYVGDAGVVEPGGRTRRWGWDASMRYEVAPYLFADLNLNYAMGRAVDEPKEANRIPLAPIFTSTGGVTYRKLQGFNGSLRYRYLSDRPANEDNSVVAAGHFIWDAQMNYTRKKWEAGLSIQNIFNTRWKETQFDTESRLQNEPAPVSEIHFTPGTPFFARMSFTLFF